MTEEDHIPLRTDVGSRRKMANDGLVRWFLGPDGTPWPDWTGRSERLGRGAWVEPTGEAVEAALRRGGFARAFRTAPGSVTPEVLLDRLVSSGTKVFLNRLGLANRAGVVAVGQTAVRAEGSRARGGLALLALDGGDAGQQRFGSWARAVGLSVARFRSGHVLGAALGREFVSVVVVQASPFAEDLTRMAAQLVGLPASEIGEFAASASLDAGDPPVGDAGR